MSLTLIDNTKTPSSKFTRIPHPTTFRTTLEEQKYWAEQVRRWFEGYGGLTGKHYFYLQEIMIPSIDEGGLIFPEWRDVDDLIFDAIEICERESKDMLIGKRRGVGLTSIFGAALPLFYTHTIPNTVVPITSDNKTKVEAILKDKIIPAYSNLNDKYKQPLLHNRRDEISFGYKDNNFIDRAGKKVKLESVKGMNSKILPRQTHKDPTAFESVRAKYGFLDELFLHPLANRVRASMSMCFGSGLKKNGWLAMGGSAGDERPESMKIAQDLYINSESLRIYPVFIPGTMGNIGECEFTGRPFMINGHSQIDVAAEYIERKLEMLSKSTDLTEYRNFKHAMPMSWEDLFDAKKSDRFPPEVMDILNEQRRYILEARPKIWIL